MFTNTTKLNRKQFREKSKMMYLTVTRSHIDSNLPVERIICDLFTVTRLTHHVIYSERLLKTLNEDNKLTTEGKYAIWIQKL